MHPRRAHEAALRAMLALTLLGFLAAGAAPRALAQSENLLDRISNERMTAFEERLTAGISGALNRYISHSQYVLSVKVIWNRDIIPAVQTPGLAPSRQKLPGFPIFVAAPGADAGDENTPPFVRMVVKVLMDETLPEYYERFVRKIVPIVARFDNARGDQVIVLKETFPVKEVGDDAPPTLPEKELMSALGQPPAPPLPPRRPVGGREAPPIPSGGPAGVGPAEAAQVAYEEGRYSDALRIVQSAFQQAVSNQERSLYVGMEGSVLYTMDNRQAAMASWKRALVYDPTNLEVQRVLQFAESQQGEATQ